MELICLSVDVEWAAPEVLDELRSLLDERGLKATFFCTHAGISVPGHERALHPNFRLQGDTVSGFRPSSWERFKDLAENEIYTHVIESTKSFVPEATGTRSHSLFFDSLLLPIYQKSGIRYDSSYLLPFVEGLRPVEKEYGVVELPIFYNDFFDLKSGKTGFELGKLGLGKTGLKVFNFHPNTVFTNAATLKDYQDSKPHYGDPSALRACRRPGVGVRTLFLNLLDHLVEKKLATATMGEVSDQWHRRHE